MASSGIFVSDMSTMSIWCKFSSCENSKVSLRIPFAFHSIMRSGCVGRFCLRPITLCECKEELDVVYEVWFFSDLFREFK